MKKILFVLKVSVLAATIWGGAYLLNPNNSDQQTPTNQVEEKKEQLQGSVQGVTETVTKQTQDLKTRAQEVNRHVSQILGAYIKPTNEASTETNNETTSESSNQENSTAQKEADESKPEPIYEKTLEYGRYLYCKQVVKDYEQQN